MSKNGTSAAVDTDQAIKLRRLERVTFDIPIRGITPLIVNRFDEKAKEMMLTAQQTSARAKKAPKDPVALFEASRYRMEDGRDGFPARAFKAAITNAARFYDGVTLVSLRQMVSVAGAGAEGLIPLEYGDITMREDAVRNASGVADLRYRAQFWPWSVTLQVRTIKGQFDIDSIFALVDAAGIGGVGEWRPASPKSATGTFGMFEVAE